MEQIKDNPLESILFISLPEGTERTIEQFTLDSSHLIPVELPPGSTELDLKDLSWEMIISAMLKLFAYKPDHEDIGYYRDFIHAVQPNIVAELTKTGVIKAEAKEFSLAEEIFLSLNHFAPEEYTTFLNLAFLYEEMAALYDKSANPLGEKYREKAFQIYLEGSGRHEDNPEMHYYSGFFFLKHQNFTKCREHFELFLGLSPEDERSPEVQKLIESLAVQNTDDQLFSEAFDLIKLGKEREALEKITEFLARNPGLWNAWFLKGWAHRRLGEYREGQQALSRCIELGEENADILNELAICAMESGDFKTAYQALKSALAIEPDNIKIISNLGVLELKKGDEQEALRYFRTAEALDPDDAVAVKYIETIESGTAG